MFRASKCPSPGEQIYKTACGVSLDVLAAVVWSRDTSWAQWAQLVSWLYITAASTCRLTPHAVLYNLFSWRWAFWCPKHV